MAVRDLLAVFDGSERDSQVLAVAGELARRDGAHLTGLCPLDVLYPAGIGPVIGGYPDAVVLQAEIERLEANARARAEKVGAAFNEQLRRDGTAGDWQVGTGPAAEEVVQRARTADAVVMSQPAPEHESLGAVRFMMEEVLLRSGRPVLFVPYAGTFLKAGTNAVLAWNGSREAARALHDALPLLPSDASVTVLLVDGPGTKGGDARAAPVADHIARHGFRATIARTMADGSVKDADVILDYVADVGADLLIMGGYGHSRTRQMIFGGVTRAMLDHMTLPVLMAH